MNRTKKVAKRWQQIKPRVLLIKAHNQRVRNGRRQPKPQRDPNRV